MARLSSPFAQPSLTAMTETLWCRTSVITIHCCLRAAGVASRSHIVGHSLATSAAICLDIDWPDPVLPTFVTGYSNVLLTFAISFPTLFWTLNQLENAVCLPLICWLLNGTDLRSTSGSSISLWTKIPRTDTFKAETWHSRIVIVAAGKAGLVAPDNNTEAARRHTAGLRST